MMSKSVLSGRMALAALAVVLVLAGAAGSAPSKPAAPGQAPAKAVVLEYKMPAGRALTYQAKTEDSRVMDVQGQTMDMGFNNTSTITFKSKGLKDKNFLLGVNIDDIAISVTSSAQGDLSPSLDAVKGKSFDMVLSPLGSEIDVSGAEALTFDMAGDTGNLSSGFRLFFPDLPGKPVKIGDTWPSNVWNEDKSAQANLRTEYQNVNTLEGFETIDGMECARIAQQMTGTINGTGNQGGMDMTFAGTTKGKDVWYFAVKEGLFVKMASESSTEMSVEIAAAGMSIPVTQTSKGEVLLVKK